MDDKELFEYHERTYKTQHIYWTPQKAALVLESWQRKFSEVSKILVLFIWISFQYFSDY